MGDHSHINRSDTPPAGRILLRIDEVDEILFAMSELAATYRRGGAPEERIQATEALSARLRELFGAAEWQQFSERRWDMRSQ